MVERISAREAWALLAADESAVLVDVRTLDEWHEVGVPDLSALGREVLTVTWTPYDAQGFAQSLREAVPSLERPLLFLCRSGTRSQQTAELAAQLGYRQSINIVEGYEGVPDDRGRRGQVCGWQYEDMPRRAFE